MDERNGINGSVVEGRVRKIKSYISVYTTCLDVCNYKLEIGRDKSGTIRVIRFPTVGSECTSTRRAHARHKRLPDARVPALLHTVQSALRSKLSEGSFGRADSLYLI